MYAPHVTERYYLSICTWFEEGVHLVPESIVPIHPQLGLLIVQLFLDFCTIFFLEWPLIFCVMTIHEVIWHESCKNFKGRDAFSKLVHRQYKLFEHYRFCQLEIRKTTLLNYKPSTA